MAINVTSQTSGVIERPVTRTEAIKNVMAERAKAEQVAPAPAQAEAAPAAPAASEPAKPNHEHLVEIERRERALDAARHELESHKRELEQLRNKQAELKDWRKALAAGGHNVEDVVQEWLGGDSKPADKAEPKANPAHVGLPPEIVARLEKLESREADEARGRAKLEKRQRIASMIPQDSEEFEATRSLGDHAIDMFLQQLEGEESKRPEGIGPAELQLLLKAFEGNTRKNLEKDLSGVAKSKWARQIMKQLLESSESPAAPEDTGVRVSDSGHEKPASTASESNDGRRSMKLTGLSNEEIKTAARARLVAKWRQ